jgi:hypothetical protein
MTAVSQATGRRREDHYDVIADGEVVGLIMMFTTIPAGLPWVWTMAPGEGEGRTQTYGYEATKEAALEAIREKLASPDMTPGTII